MPAGAEPPAIYHRPVGCALADRFPQLEAGFAPAEEVAAARVLFQAQGAQWYAVKMKPEGAVFTAVLPRPRKSLPTFSYYIEVTDRTTATYRTIEYEVGVVDSPSACKGRLLAGPLASASIVLQGPPGVPAPPSGFASTGVVTVPGHGTAVAAKTPPAPPRKADTSTTAQGKTGTGNTPGGKPAATATPATAAKTSTPGGRGAVQKGGGGIGATALVLGGLGVAGGAVALGASRRGAENPFSARNTSSTASSPPPSTNPRPSYEISFSPSPGLDASPCAGSPTFFTSQRVTTDANGSFDTFWTPALRVVGQAQSAVFQATLSCPTAAISGVISATGSTSGYSGTFQFGPQQGQVTITRVP